MAIHETNIVHACMSKASEMGARVFKNTRGMFRLLNAEAKVKAGLLCPGASDLIGWKSIVITPDMVGKRFARFVAAEGKTATGRATSEQLNFIEQVQKAGGIAGVVRNSDDMKNLLNNS